MICKCGEEYEVFKMGPKMNQQEVNCAKAILAKVYPDISPEDIVSATSTFNPEEAWDNIAQFIRESGTDGIEEMKKRGVIIQVGQPELKVVG